MKSQPNRIELGATPRIKQKPISLSDLPTLTFCWPISKVYSKVTYGTDFDIDVKMIEKEETTVKLLENKRVKAIHGVEIILSELHLDLEWQQTKFQSQSPCHLIHGWTDRQCYKITTNWSRGTDDPDFQNFALQFAFKYSNRTWPPHNGQGVSTIMALFIFFKLSFKHLKSRDCQIS